jgi:hypothetical protein
MIERPIMSEGSNLLFGRPCDNRANTHLVETPLAANRLDTNGEAPAMRSRWPLPFVLMHVASFSGAATAETLDQQRCANNDADLSISGCTAVIQSGHETNVANAFYNRGLAYGRKDQYDRTVRDSDQAIQLNPNEGFLQPPGS